MDRTLTLQNLHMGNCPRRKSLTGQNPGFGEEALAWARHCLQARVTGPGSLARLLCASEFSELRGQQAGSSHLQGSFLHRKPGSSFKEPHTMSHLVKTQACFYNLYHMSKTQNKFNNAHIPSVMLQREN